MASSWYVRTLQNQNAPLNRLTNKYKILPGGVTCLSVEIVREFVTTRHLFFLEAGAQLLGILTVQKVKSTTNQG